MRIAELDLTRYGRFTDRRLSFPAPKAGTPDLHVIFGPNEAGKSTLFSAWLDLLYGIPLQSRYSFLHAGPTMQIGARLGLAQGMQDLIRVKKTAASLQDGSGQPLPEAVMQGLLAGLTRDDYRAMFSLDDDTLEEGGDAILSSRGDLGEMLFSASAGLQALAPQMEALRRELDAFHKPGGRKTALKAAKDQLAALEARRKELDVTAPAAQRLQKAAQEAEGAWRAAAREEDALRRALDLVRASQALAPQRSRLDRLRADLAPLDHLPGATLDQDQALRAIEAALGEVMGQVSARADTLAETERRLTALQRDPAVLTLADRIAEAEALRAGHGTALTDLPKRRDEAAEIANGLLRRMGRLGLAGRPEAHALPPATLARLRALAAQREVLAQALALARTEAQEAADRLAALGPAPAAPTDIPALAPLLAGLRAQDPEAALARAETDLAARQADLARALLAMEPWRGTPEALAGLQPPTPWDLAALETEEAASAKALAEARHRQGMAQPDLSAADRPHVTLAEAAELRRLREAAWAEHLRSLTPQSAAAFETALRLDDQVTLRLAEARQAEAQEARQSAEAAKAQAALKTALQRRAALEDRLDGLSRGLGLPGAGLPDLRRWIQQREAVLAAQLAHQAAQDGLARARQGLDEARLALAQALDSPDLGFARLRAMAQDRLDGLEAARTAARQHESASAEAARRALALDRASAAQADWLRAWAETAPQGSALATATEGLPALIDELDLLGQDLARAADLAHRISKMEANSQAFRAATLALLADLDMAPDSPWERLPDRLTRARQTETDWAQLTADRDKALAQQAEAQSRIDRLSSDRAALARALNWDGAGSLADHLAACLAAARLRADLAALSADLEGQPAPEPDDILQAKAQELDSRLTLARTTTEERFAALTEARRALQAIGGDDGVARLASERANLLHALREEARAHLALRLALTGFELGLRRYRESHRSAMLSRASEAFRRLTLGAYRGLDAQPSGSSEILMAIPAQGGAKLAADLSKGTRFQLYLALRIAGYHELAKSRSPVPFVADDIMETFDDNRAAEAFGLLADMAQTGQVIYLTHHRHLCDIAQKACPGARILDLSAGNTT